MQLTGGAAHREGGCTGSGCSRDHMEERSGSCSTACRSSLLLATALPHHRGTPRTGPPTPHAAAQADGAQCRGRGGAGVHSSATGDGWMDDRRAKQRQRGG